MVSEYFMKPMGAEHDALWLLDGEKKHEKAFCCFNGVARDYARFGELMLTDGKWKSKQIVPQNYMKAALMTASYLKDPTEGGKPIDFTTINSGRCSFDIEIIEPNDRRIIEIPECIFLK